MGHKHSPRFAKLVALFSASALALLATVTIQQRALTAATADIAYAPKDFTNRHTYTRLFKCGRTVNKIQHAAAPDTDEARYQSRICRRIAK